MNVQVYARDHEAAAMSLHFCAAEEGEVCDAITMEPMGAPNDELDRYGLRERPELNCAVCQQCKHRFDARALMRYFVCHSVRCPICRTGHTEPMDVRRGPLAEEGWVSPKVWRVIVSGTTFRLVLLALRFMAEE
jgi:hypothetical protein